MIKPRNCSLAYDYIIERVEFSCADILTHHFAVHHGAYFYVAAALLDPSSVENNSSRGTSVRKPNVPRLTPRMGMSARATARAAAKSVPSPPSTTTKFRARDAMASRSIVSMPGACGAV